MHAAAGYRQEKLDREKQELSVILASGIFSRAPNLALLLTYVCAKYFEGVAEQIKEYNIAVEALGRPADFDQKRDSIVRVEAHRLRKRLREYYESNGAGHPIRIEIPPGQYAPRFLPSGAPLPDSPPDPQPPHDGAFTSLVPSAAEHDPSESALVPRPPDVTVPAPSHGSPRVRYAIAAVLLVAAATTVALWRRPEKKAVLPAALPPIALPAANPLEVRILAGHLNGDYTDRLGRVWQSDRYFQGGSVFESHDHPIFGTREPRIYQSRREGSFSYNVPVPPGVYELRLHFAETLYGENNVAGGGEASRVFNVWINGQPGLHEFDVIAEAGPSTADIRAFKDVSPTPDGKIHLQFEAFSNPPLLNAIEIVPGTPGRLRPIRMISLDHIYTDKQGRVWEPDHYARGGQLVSRTTTVDGTPDPELFRGERYGNLRYVIPVPPGRYGATFYFAEAWFGPDTPAGGGVGSRVFDILVNGVALRRGFDLFKEAHGALRAVTWTVHNIEADAQGKLNFALTPLRNYACVNAVEVFDESK